MQEIVDIAADLRDLTALSASVVALLGAVLGIFKYFQYRSRRDKIALVRQSFDAVVHSLASTVEVERLSGAILLRRFYDPETEVGIAGTPYWKEAVNVSAAILRGQPTGNFQKLLADGLALAPSLERADLQKTNLQFAYLSRSGSGGVTNLSHADFYRADLSRASLKSSFVQGAQFYQARLQDTIFTGADLREANFFEADLQGAVFKGALLDGAKFGGARNVPAAIAEKLDPEHVYRGYAPRKPLPSPVRNARPIQVFISKPSCLDYGQESFVRSVLARLPAERIRPVTLEPAAYPPSGALREVQRLMVSCSGALIFGFRQLEVRNGTWRPGTSQQKMIKRQYFPTPWNHIEAGMAAMSNLPLMIVCERGVEGGIFDTGTDDHQVYRLFMDQDEATYAQTVTAWCANVRAFSNVTR